MPPPTPPVYLIREHVEAICRSVAFDAKESLQSLLRYIVEQINAAMEVTEGILATDLWRNAAQDKAQIDKTKIRMGVVRLRKGLDAYYKSAKALSAIVEISVPLAGLDDKTRQFKHYSADFMFRPAMLKSAATFSQVLFNKYGLPVMAGECWFTKGTEPLDLLLGYWRSAAVNFALFAPAIQKLRRGVRLIHLRFEIAPQHSCVSHADRVWQHVKEGSHARALKENAAAILVGFHPIFDSGLGQRRLKT